MAAIAIGIAWILWLAHESLSPDEAASAPVVPVQSAPPAPVASVQSAPPPREVGVLAPTPQPSPPSASRAADTTLPPPGAVSRAAPSPDPALQLTFEAPVHVAAGEGFDVRVALAPRQPIGRVRVELVYDAALLKVRTVEEVDVTQRQAAERAFRIDQMSDGQVELVLAKEQGLPAPGAAMSAALAQFEALMPGRAEIRISNITVSDPTNKSLAWSATGRESEIVID